MSAPKRKTAAMHPNAQLAVVWALDAAQRRVDGEGNIDECEAAYLALEEYMRLLDESGDPLVDEVLDCMDVVWYELIKI